MGLRRSQEILELETGHPFTIARGGSSAYRAVWVCLADEAAPSALPAAPGLGVVRR